VNASDPPHAVLHRNGVLSDLGTGYGAGSFSRAWEINDTRQIVGERARHQSSPVRAFLLRNGRFRDLGTLGGAGGSFGTSSVAYGINDRRQIVGAAQPPSGPLHAFLWERGVMRDLGTLGGDDEATEARDVNDAAQVVGSSPTTAGFTHAFLWESGAMQDLGTLGGNSSHAYGINVDGDVVGGSRTANSPPNNADHAFLWAKGRMVDLNAVVTNLPGNVVLELARAIKRRRQHCGHDVLRLLRAWEDGTHPHAPPRSELTARRAWAVTRAAVDAVAAAQERRGTASRPARIWRAAARARRRAARGSGRAGAGPTASAGV
jgi:probable HAF family extracellular repeat protein